jgi:hypothetical protein
LTDHTLLQVTLILEREIVDIILIEEPPEIITEFRKRSMGGGIARMINL